MSDISSVFEVFFTWTKPVKFPEPILLDPLSILVFISTALARMSPHGHSNSNAKVAVLYLPVLSSERTVELSVRIAPLLLTTTAPEKSLHTK
jgi:hypothetical protein